MSTCLPRRIVVAQLPSVDRITRRAPQDSTIPARLSEIELFDRAQAAVTREFSFRRDPTIGGRRGWTIGGQPFSPDRIEALPGSTVTAAAMSSTATTPSTKTWE